jgi:tungstate transport system ATP-binding protein
MSAMHLSPIRSVYELRSLTKDYAGRRVLDILSMDILRGEVLALVGPSGSGKSTLLRLLNFLEFPATGTITFAGRTYQAGQDMPIEQRRKVTTVFQKPMLLERSVWDNVSYGLRLRGKNHSKERIQASLEEVGLSHLSHQRARTLSGGEAQRVALARAMVLNPDVLLLDEPTANLDPYNVGLIEGIIRASMTSTGPRSCWSPIISSRPSAWHRGPVFYWMVKSSKSQKPGNSSKAPLTHARLRLYAETWSTDPPYKTLSHFWRTDEDNIAYHLNGPCIGNSYIKRLRCSNACPHA